MKKIIITLILIFQAILAQGETDPYSTIAKLPENKMIWPLPEFSGLKENIHITGEFIESKPILIVEQGNWAEHTHFVRYKITTPHNLYPHKEISFIVVRRWPTSESGIRLKVLRYPFREGSMDFILKKADQVKYMDYFNIMIYKNN